MPYTRTLLVTHFKYSSVYMPINSGVCCLGSNEVPTVSCPGSTKPEVVVPEAISAFLFRTSCPCKYSFLDNNKKLTPRRDVPSYPKVSLQPACEETTICVHSLRAHPPTHTSDPIQGRLPTPLQSACLQSQLSPGPWQWHASIILRQNIFPR